MTTWEQQLAQWSRWLDRNLDDPALIAGCHRIGKKIAKAGDAG